MIAETLQKELRERYNPDGSTLRRHQMRMLEMLQYVDSVCTKHNIRYWLCSGTLLGAVRHGGFIPWDDDLDIEMLKEDYKKFVKIVEKEKNDDYVLQTHKTDPNYYAPYAKLRDIHSYLKENHPLDAHYKYHGIFIDIFVLVPSSSYLLTRIPEFFQRLIYHANRIKPDRKILTKCLYCVTYKIVFPFFSTMGRIGAGNQLRIVHGSFYCKPRYSTDIFPLDWLEFEGMPFPVPHNCDGYLRKIYGDYMKLPDLSKIRKHLTVIEFYDR